MPVVSEPAPITRVFGVPRDGMKRHVFVAANFFMQRMLNRYRDDLEVDGAACRNWRPRPTIRFHI